MRATWYAQALYELEAEGKMSDAPSLERFVDTVRGNGHAHMLPKIIRAYERITQRAEKRSTIEVTTAEECAQDEVTKLLRKEPFAHVLLPTHKKVVRKVDPTLIGGAIVRTGGVRIDASFKRKLQELYQSLITS